MDLYTEINAKWCTIVCDDYVVTYTHTSMERQNINIFMYRSYKTKKKTKK